MGKGRGHEEPKHEIKVLYLGSTSHHHCAICGKAEKTINKISDFAKSLLFSNKLSCCTLALVLVYLTLMQQMFKRSKYRYKFSTIEKSKQKGDNT